MKAVSIIGALATGALLLIAGAGCETSSAESATQAEILISPSSVTLSKGQSAEFVATGWYEYSWYLSDGSLGTLSNQKGDRTVYTAVAAGSNAVQTLTCSSIVGTNGTTVSGTALIIQK